MLGGVAGVNPYVNNYQYYNAVRAMSASRVVPVQASGKAGTVIASGRGASPETPVEPVRPVPVVGADSSKGISYAIPFLRQGMDPAELAVRMRIRYVDGQEPKAGSDGINETSGVESAREAAEKGECKTCRERKYQDGSDDPGVSYKTPTRISPEQAASAVRGHEMEHVVREQAKAVREDRKVVSQSVSLHTAICPECGRVYVSGGTTKTTTAGDGGTYGTAGQKEQQYRVPFDTAA